jgi:hypothetical protein
VAESAQPRSVVVAVPSQVPAVRELAAAHGAEVVEIPSRGIEPVATVTLALVGTAAAVRAATHVVEELIRGGQVIDLRPGAPRPFYRSRDVAYGIVIVLAVDGKVTATVKNPGAMFGKVISALPQLLAGGGSAKEVVRVVSKAFGAEVRIDTAGNPAPDGDA